MTKSYLSELQMTLLAFFPHSLYSCPDLLKTVLLEYFNEQYDYFNVYYSIFMIHHL